jgi:inhibitor of KinA
VRLYNPKKEPPVLLSAGDYVRYVSITENEYYEIQKLVQDDKYEVNVIITEGGELRE